MLKSGITNPLKSLYDRRICTLLGLSESVCGHDTTGTDVVFVRPTDGIPVFYEEGAGEVTLAPAEGPRYLLDSAGRRHPVNEYGS